MVSTRNDLDRVVESLWTKDHFGLAIAERKGGVYGVAFAPEEMKSRAGGLREL